MTLSMFHVPLALFIIILYLITLDSSITDTEACHWRCSWAISITL